MRESRTVSTPLGQQFQLCASQGPKSDAEVDEMKNIPYANIIGSVMYVMICTRPDLAHAVSVTSRYMSNPGKSHWQALKWMLRYLKGSSEYGISYKGFRDQTKEVLEGFCDSDYASNKDNRKSQTGYIFTMYGSAVSWKSNLQSVVALSTTEAEYIALTDAVNESFWIRGMMEDLGEKQGKVAVNCDSSSAICLSKHQTFHERSKHIDVRLHFIRDEVKKGMIEVRKIATEHNPADALTKVIPASKFAYCMELMNVLRR
ncbi:secreted RxLR effector protein 161-like [Salvia splendens]|uniref:secreted RxLR effector protein 161-like n=1 Tax=Salvia splendens TaxID=180675 RepID=UPI001C27C304|nr:secreted RxLR effector protein 161-like [Salvia splendens]